MRGQDVNDTETEAPREPWHLDKRVPIALIFAILVQTAGMGWWAAQIDSRVAHLEQVNVRNAGETERLTRVEEKIVAQGEVLERIDRRLERMEERPRR